MIFKNIPLPFPLRWNVFGANLLDFISLNKVGDFKDIYSDSNKTKYNYFNATYYVSSYDEKSAPVHV